MRKIFLWTALLCVLLGLCACTPQTERTPDDVSSEEEASSSEEEPKDPNFPVTVGGVTLTEKPKRAVSLNPSVTEVLFDMGLGDVLTGVCDACTYPEEALALSGCGTQIQPNIDAILEADPQVLFTLGPLPQSAREALGDDIIVVQLTKPQETEKLPDYYLQLALSLLGEEDGRAAAAQFSDPLKSAYSAILEAAGSIETKPLGAFAAFLPLTLATGDTEQGRLLELCGIRNAAAEYTDWQYPQELLLPFNPEILVFDTRTVALEEIQGHANYKTTPCVTANRLLGVDGSAMENGGKRLYQAMLQMALLSGAQGLPQELEALLAGGAPSDAAESGAQDNSAASEQTTGDSSQQEDEEPDAAS